MASCRMGIRSCDYMYKDMGRQERQGLQICKLGWHYVDYFMAGYYLYAHTAWKHVVFKPIKVNPVRKDEAFQQGLSHHLQEIQLHSLQNLFKNLLQGCPCYPLFLWRSGHNRSAKFIIKFSYYIQKGSVIQKKPLKQMGLCKGVNIELV